MNKWNIDSVCLISEAITKEELKVRIESVANILYFYFCQLQENQSKVNSKVQDFQGDCIQSQLEVI